MTRCSSGTPLPGDGRAARTPASWVRIGAILAPLSAFATADGASPVFTDVTEESGINHSQHQLPAETEMQVYMSGGAAAADFDGDGWVDLYVTRLDESDLLYRNKGDGTFEDVTASAFGAGHLSAIRTNGCAWGDIDNDGDLDLYVTSIGSNRYHLFVNSGSGTFTEEAVTRGAAVVGEDTHFGFSVTFGDYDLDGFLDLHVTEWRFKNQNPTGAAQNTRLLRNLGPAHPGFFEDVTQAAGVAMDAVQPINASFADSQSFASRFCDMDRDGFPDLLIASDHGTSRLFWNDGDGTFTDGTGVAGVGTDSYGMRSTLGDYDGDGDLDWFVTSIYDTSHVIVRRDGNRLYRNDGNRTFTDATDSAGVRDSQWGWGAAFLDYDNDGDLDLIATDGIRVWFDVFLGGYEEDRTILWRNNGDATFSEVAVPDSGVADTGSGKGLLTFDYDNDGDLDVFIVNNGESPILYRNNTDGAQDWLKVRSVGRSTNRGGLGTRVSLTSTDGTLPLVRETDGGNNFLGQSDGVAHFGLGPISSEPISRLTVRWPSGVSKELRDVGRNQVLVITEPADEFSLVVEADRSGEVVLRWDSLIGGLYSVESSPDLAEWEEVAQVSADGPRTEFFHPLAEGGQAATYFRVVRLLPQ